MAAVMDKVEILERIKDAVSRVTGISADDITPDSVLGEDLPADSLDLVEIIMSLEDNIGIDLNDDEVNAAKTVDDLADLIFSVVEKDDS